MPKKGANISLSSYDEIFSTQESRQETGERVVMLSLDRYILLRIIHFGS